MKLRTALITAILCTATPTMAQLQPGTPAPAPAQHAAAPAAAEKPTEKLDPAKDAAIRHLMDITETSKMGDNINAGITRQVHDVMGRAIAQDQLPKFMEAFSQKFNAAAPSSAVTDAMVPVYAKNFSMEDIQGLVKFYESPLGMRVVKAMPQVNAELQQAGILIDQKAAMATLRGMSDEYPQLKQMLPADPSAPTSGATPSVGAPPAAATLSGNPPSTISPPQR
ncbi:MAG TPA: DUF2059 domain-containing protein [Candidatus Acidoferrales bacterium]